MTQKVFLRRLVALFWVLGFCLNIQAGEPVEIMAGEIILKFKEGTSEDQKRTLEKKFNLTQFGFDPTIQVYFYNAPEDEVTSKVAEINKESIVKYSQANYVGKSNAIPNDPFYSEQWYLPHIGIPQVWDEFTGSNTIRVAVIDSGINYSLGEFSSISDTGWDWNYVSANSFPQDDNGHGTLIAGIIAANTNNGIGVAGISSKVKIVTLKVSGLFENLEVFGALNRARDAGCKIINLSYGKLIKEPAVEEKIQWLNEQGILVVCSAGNGSIDGIGDNCDVSPQYPSNYSSSNIISVAATTPSSSLANFSNYGATSVHIAAPGTDIFSTLGVGEKYRQVIKNYSFSFSGESWQGFYFSTGGLYGFYWSLYDGGWITDYFYATRQYATNSSYYIESPLIDCRGYANINLISTFSGGLGFGDQLGIYSGTAGWSNKVQAGSLISGVVEGSYVRYLTPLENSIGRIWYWLTSDWFGNGYMEIDNVEVSGVPIYSSNSGTSFAAPIVAGVAAMVMSQNPNLTHLQVKDIILQTARKVSALDGKVVSGGIVDAVAALREAKVRIVVPPAITSSTSASGTAGSSFSYTITASGAPTSYNASSLPTGVSLNTSTGAISGTPTSAGTFTASISASNSAGTGAATLTITVAKGTPSITAAPTASAISYGQSLSNSSLSGGSASVAGNFSFTSPGTTPSTGISSHSVTFTPNSTANYNTVTTTVNVTVNKASPTITSAPTATAITRGQTLASSTLSGGSANVAGTFAWSAPATTPSAGTSTQAVTFSPSDSGNYNTTTATVSVTVNKATPTVLVIPTASSITQAQSLANSTLSGGLANVAGSFAWTTPSTVPILGASSHSVTFTPSDTANYNTVTMAVGVVVNQAPTPPPSGLAISSDLSAVLLNLGSSFSYSITASGSPTSYGARGLPVGLSVNAQTGLISGKPSRTGTFTVTLQAMKKGATTASATKVFTVVQTPSFSYAATINAKRNANVNIQPKVAGFPAPTFSVVSGSLPPGLSLNTSTAAITGKPTTAGTYSFTVRGSNSVGNTDRATTIVVK